MLNFLIIVDTCGAYTREALLDLGYHPKVIVAKAEKAARKGYTDYGVVVDRPWLTDKGREYLAKHE